MGAVAPMKYRSSQLTSLENSAEEAAEQLESVPWDTLLDIPWATLDDMILH